MPFPFFLALLFHCFAPEVSPNHVELCGSLVFQEKNNFKNSSF